MRRYLHPTVLAKRVSAKMGGIPFQVALQIKGKKDLLLVGVEGDLETRRPGQALAEYRAWGASEYGDLDQQDVLAKVRAQIEVVDVLEIRDGAFKLVHRFKAWKEFVDWLGVGSEPDAMFNVALPASLHLATKELAERRRAEGGEGSMRAVMIEALEKLHEEVG